MPQEKGGETGLEHSCIESDSLLSSVDGHVLGKRQNTWQPAELLSSFSSSVAITATGSNMADRNRACHSGTSMTISVGCPPPWTQAGSVRTKTITSPPGLTTRCISSNALRGSSKVFKRPQACHDVKTAVGMRQGLGIRLTDESARASSSRFGQSGLADVAAGYAAEGVSRETQEEPTATGHVKQSSDLQMSGPRPKKHLD